MKQYIRSIWNIFYNLYNRICLRFPWLHNFVLYAIIGVLAAMFDYAIFYGLVNFAGLNPEISSLIGNLCGFMFTFSGNTFYNFKKSTHVLFRFISYFCIATGGMTLSTLLIYYGKNLLNLYILKAVLVLFVIPVIQFVLNKKITYRDFAAGDTSIIASPGKWWKEKSFLQKFFVLFIICSAAMWVIVPSTYHTTLHFDPAESPSSDPILTGLHLERIAGHGALIITANPRHMEKEIEKMFGYSPKWYQQDLSYCARFEKTKTYKYFLAALPHSSPKIQD